MRLRKYPRGVARSVRTEMEYVFGGGSLLLGPRLNELTWLLKEIDVTERTA